MGWICLWFLAGCSNRPPAPERNFEVVTQEDWGPCSCPGLEPAKSIWRITGDDATGPAVFTGLSKDCEVEVTAKYPEGGGPLPQETRTTAWGLGAEPTAFRCPDSAGKVLFYQEELNCKTLFHNSEGQGPETYRLLTDTMHGHSLPVEDGESRMLDCGMEIRVFAPDWTLASADSEVVDGVRQVSLRWRSAPTANLHLVDRNDEDLAWQLLIGSYGAIGTDAEGRASFGAGRGVLSGVAMSLPMQPVVAYHLGLESEIVMKMDIPTPLRVVLTHRQRMPVCKDGPRFSCREDPVSGQALCYCEQEDDGSTVLIWSGGEVHVPEGTRTISLDTSAFTGEVVGQLDGGSYYSLNLISVDAQSPSSLNLYQERASRTEDGFRFPNVAPGRYIVETGIWPLNTRLSEVIVVEDGPVDVGTLVMED